MPLSSPEELERIRGAAALKSLADSPNASRLLAGKGRNQRSNEIVSKSIERSGLDRKELVSAVKTDRPRYDRMVANASKSDVERAPKPKPTAAPVVQQTKPTAAPVVQQTKPTIPVERKPKPTAAPVVQQTPVKRAPKVSGGLTPEQLKMYDRAYKNKGNIFARGTIRNAYNKMTPEEQKAFRAHAASQNHNWGNYFESWFNSYDNGSIILTEEIVDKIIKQLSRES